MHREPDRDFFLLTTMDWAAVRASAPPATRAYAIATAVSREAAVCPLLFEAGKTPEVLACLRALGRDLLGVRLPDTTRRAAPDAAQTLGTAADLLHRLRLVAGLAARVGAA